MDNYTIDLNFDDTTNNWTAKLDLGGDTLLTKDGSTAKEVVNAVLTGLPVQPPSKPSALIRTALHDLELAEESQNYKVDMSVYHLPEDNNCRVCFAGSVMAFSLNASIDSRPSISKWGDRWMNALYALDYFRCLDVSGAYRTLNRPMPKGLGVINSDMAIDYKEDPEGFKNQMAQLADLLEALGD